VGKGNALREHITLQKSNGNASYIIYCSRCDTMTYAVSGRGAMFYREALKLARRHMCK
jgi:hypothetical protein